MNNTESQAVQKRAQLFPLGQIVATPGCPGQHVSTLAGSGVMTPTAVNRAPVAETSSYMASNQSLATCPSFNGSLSSK